MEDFTGMLEVVMIGELCKRSSSLKHSMRQLNHQVRYQPVSLEFGSLHLCLASSASTKMKKKALTTCSSRILAIMSTLPVIQVVKKSYTVLISTRIW